MTVLDFLLELRKRGVELQLVDERLVSRGPKGALTSDLAATLQQRRHEIIAFLKEGLIERGGTRPIPPIVPAPRAGLMPLSFTQERLWYLSQVEKNPAVFNLPLCLHITGALRVDVLQRCLDAIADRHEALRTTIVVEGGVGFQKIHPPRGLPLVHVDLRGRNGTAAGASALDLLEREASAPFDLIARPAIRSTLVCCSDTEHYLLVVTHHLFTDGASVTIFLDELVALYEAFHIGRPSPLGPVALQFADYAVWQRDWLQGVALDEQLAYWKERLGDAVPALDLPTDFPRPAMRGSTGAKESLRLPRIVVQALAAIALEEGATTYMAMVALFTALLHRYTGQNDLVMGTPVANRTRRESEGIMGYIANTLVLRTDCSGEPTFRQLIRRVRDGCVGAFRHQDMPFQKIVEALRPPRDLSRTPIYQVFFTYEEVFAEPPRMGDLALSRVIVGSTVARQDVSAFLRQVDGEVLGALEYNTELFTQATMVRLIGNLGTLARSAAAEPERPITQLDILTDQERAAFAAWSATTMSCPDQLLHELVEAQASATPDRVALRAADGELSYRELDARANRLAHALRSRGVGADTLVGVCLERSLDMVVALLAVLKTGAAYVPMDPDFPASRLAFMVQDARLRMILCHLATADRVPAGAPALRVDEATPPAAPVGGPAGRTATPESRAYVIYTSGSTGKPKGVEVRHRNVVNFLTAVRARPGITSDEVLVAVTTLSFDIAVLELFLPLTAGGRVVVAPREVAMDGGRLARLLREERATCMQATPATWRMLFDAGWTGQSGLRALCGGEALSADLAQRLLPAVGELWNMYGPTETAVWSTCARITDAAAPITIGSPIGNTVLRTVDGHGQLVPVGVPGELLIGGAGVAQGYLGQPELTAERFVKDPTGLDPIGVFYRTGDRVRVHPDGQLEYLGRLDDQVKVQGYRIELGEIEAALAELAEVGESAATVRSEAAGDARLVAYVVYRAGRQLTMSEVRRHLRERLPAYMVPGLVVELDALPRTPNGKIDRRALPDPLDVGAAARAFDPPRSEAEQIVAEAWAALLPVDRVGRNDNFFELGGHSLLSMRAVAAIEQRTGAHLDPRLMFFQTVEQIAANLESQLATVAS